MRRHRSRLSRANRNRPPFVAPLFVRLCSGIADNLGLLLRTGFLLGAIVLAADLRQAIDTPEDDRQSVQILESDAPPASEVVKEPADRGTVMTDGVRRALNCTYRDYREAHYDDCVDEPSDVYPGPPANPDDRGFLRDESTVLLARLATAGATNTP